MKKLITIVLSFSLLIILSSNNHVRLYYALLNQSINDSTWLINLETNLRGETDTAAPDVEQVFGSRFIEDANYYYRFYIGNSKNYVTGLGGDIDQIFLSRKSKSDGLEGYQGWNKYLDGDYAKIIIGSDDTTDWDGKNLYLGDIIQTDSNYLMYYFAFNTAYQTGYATSNDLLNWTKYSGNPINLSNNNIIQNVFYYDDTLRLTASQSGVIKYYYTINGIDFTYIKDIELNDSSLYLYDVIQIGSTFYLYTGGDDIISGQNFSYQNIYAYTTTDFNTFNYEGVQIHNHNASQLGLEYPRLLKIGTKWHMFYSWLHWRNRTENEESGTTSPYISERVAVLNNAIPLTNYYSYEFPDYVKRYYAVSDSLWENSTLYEQFTGDTATKTGSFAYAQLEAFGNAQSGSLSWPIYTLYDSTDFSVKVKIFPNANSNHIIVQQDNSGGTRGWYMQTNNNKLVVGLSGNGATIDKLYTSVSDITFPDGYRDPSNQQMCWVGFVFQNDSLRLCINDSLGVAVTTTNNNSMSYIYNSGNNVEMLEATNAYLFYIRNVSFLSGQTDNEFINLDLY